MKVFISWSGKRSKALANALRDWLPMALQYVEPWVSDKDISAGDRWAHAIAGELESSNFGIICVTPENLHSEWVLFESGALSKSMLDAKVIPLLYGLEISDLSGPLSQFQAQKLEESGVMEIVKSINKVSETKTQEQIVEQLVPALWPRLKDALEAIPDIEPSEKQMRPQHEILEELVTSVRGINSRLGELEELAVGDDRHRRRRIHRFHPHMLEEISMMEGREGGGPLHLLMIAGLFRDELPWLAEVLAEAYREIKDGHAGSAEKIISRLRRTVKHIMHSKMFYEATGGSKESMMLVEELPMMLDMALERTHSDRSLADDRAS